MSSLSLGGSIERLHMLREHRIGSFETIAAGMELLYLVDEVRDAFM